MGLDERRTWRAWLLAETICRAGAVCLMLMAVQSAVTDRHHGAWSMWTAAALFAAGTVVSRKRGKAPLWFEGVNIAGFCLVHYGLVRIANAAMV